MTSDSGRHAQRGDVKQAPSEGCQSGPKASPERSSPSIDEELIERIARSLARSDGIPDDAPVGDYARNARDVYNEVVESLLSDRAKLEEALRRLEAASTTIAGRLDMLSIGTEIGCAIEEARAALNRSTDR